VTLDRKLFLLDFQLTAISGWLLIANEVILKSLSVFFCFCFHNFANRVFSVQYEVYLREGLSSLLHALWSEPHMREGSTLSKKVFLPPSDNSIV
jgi:hypothetical protein